MKGLIDIGPAWNDLGHEPVEEAIQQHAEWLLIRSDVELSCELSRLAYAGYAGADRILRWFWNYKP